VRYNSFKQHNREKRARASLEEICEQYNHDNLDKHDNLGYKYTNLGNYLFFPRSPKPGKPLPPFLAHTPDIPGTKLPSDAISVGLTRLKGLSTNYIYMPRVKGLPEIAT